MAEVFDKILQHSKTFLLKNPLFMFLADLNFSISLSKKHAAVHLNTSQALTSL